MATILSLVQSNLVTQPHLVKGVLETMIERGARDLFAVLPALAFEGSSFDFNQEATIPTNSSLFDPYDVANALPEGVGTVAQKTVAMKAFGRNIDTPVINLLGKSNINNVRQEDLKRAAKKFAYDYLVSAIQGMGWSTLTPHGLDYWIDSYGGEADYNAGGATMAKPLLNEMLSRYKREGFNVIYADRETTVEYRNILDAAPGNISTMFMDERFGRPVLTYDGIPWIQLDIAGGAKALVGAALSDTGSTTTRITAVASDKNFPGFSKADIGKTVTIAASTGVITAVNANGMVADTDTNLGLTGNANVAVAKAPTIYAVRMNEVDGFTSLYYSSQGGDMLANPGEYYGPIAGWSAKDLGHLEDLEVVRSRVTAYTNFVGLAPDFAVRLRNFAYPA